MDGSPPRRMRSGPFVCFFSIKEFLLITWILHL
jgi:hypothetical protein